jgi:hypothetical protein
MSKVTTKKQQNSKQLELSPLFKFQISWSPCIGNELKVAVGPTKTMLLLGAQQTL